MPTQEELAKHIFEKTYQCRTTVLAYETIQPTPKSTLTPVNVTVRNSVGSVCHISEEPANDAIIQLYSNTSQYSDNDDLNESIAQIVQPYNLTINEMIEILIDHEYPLVLMDIKRVGEIMEVVGDYLEYLTTAMTLSVHSIGPSEADVASLRSFQNELIPLQYLLSVEGRSKEYWGDLEDVFTTTGYTLGGTNKAIEDLEDQWKTRAPTFSENRQDKLRKKQQGETVVHNPKFSQPVEPVNTWGGESTGTDPISFNDAVRMGKDSSPYDF